MENIYAIYMEKDITIYGLIYMENIYAIYMEKDITIYGLRCFEPVWISVPYYVYTKVIFEALDNCFFNPKRKQKRVLFFGDRFFKDCIGTFNMRFTSLTANCVTL